MPIQSKLRVIKHTYPNGTTTYRVTGTVDGKQVRKNFKKRADALQERNRLTADKLNREPHAREIWTTLSAAENRDAVAAVSKLRLAKCDKTLSFAVDFMLKHHIGGAEDILISDAVDAYVAHKQEERDRGIISAPQMRSIDKEMNIFKDKLGEQGLDTITKDDLEAVIDRPRTSNMGKEPKGFSMKTWNNRRALLGTFFRYAVTRKWIVRNPIQDVRQFRVKHRRGTAATLTSEKAGKLMAFLETYNGASDAKNPRTVFEPGFLVPYFALALFAGVRPDWKYGEISKFRPEHIDFDNGVIRIEPEISKVNERRIVKLQPNLRAWLEKYPLTEEGAVPRPNPDRVLADIRSTFDLGHDVLRHTYISMTVGAFKSVGDAALQAGNSEAVIRKHYLDLKTESEADQFWRIMPRGKRLPRKLEKRDGLWVAAIKASPAA